LFSAILATCGGIAIALVLGFVAFVNGVATWSPPDNPRAEGIVVLTGGSARIDGALHLLAEGRASRLLISGVNPSVGTRALSGTVDNALNAMLDCCVDLGHAAQDTVGNAAETREWAESRHFTSLIVVTSAYHMPRSLAELAEAMPGVTLIPYPVSNPELRLTEWWSNPGAFALLIREYGKYLLTATRQVFVRSNAAPANVAAI
jgi:uncharacterized SAM-binding protein YcdF (DUF218 family)